jgi:glycosyltransferase involved in cell wall biosynthesis
MDGSATSPEQAARRVRLAYLVSHPIQYQAPLLRRIAQEPDLDLTVLFGSDLSVRPYRDAGFGVEVAWDVPLLEGYASEFLPAWRDDGTISATSPVSRGLHHRLRQGKSGKSFDALWLHGYASVNAVQALLAARALGIPVLLRAESWLGDRDRTLWMHAAKWVFFQALRHGVSAVLPIGQRNAAYWQHSLGERVAQFPMPYAVDNAAFAEQARAAAGREPELRAELRLPAGRPVVLFASKLQPRKHAGHLIAAYRELLRAWTGSVTPALVIVGDGEERPRLEAMAAGLEGVRFAGFRNQSELPRFFQMAAVFVLPSEQEPWGLVVNEAMACGCAVVVSDAVGCQPDLVTDGVEGCVFPSGDVAALGHALRRVLATPETAVAMGAAARRRMSTWGFEEDVKGLRTALAALLPAILGPEAGLGPERG